MEADELARLDLYVGAIDEPWFDQFDLSDDNPKIADLKKKLKDRIANQNTLLEQIEKDIK